MHNEASLEPGCDERGGDHPQLVLAASFEKRQLPEPCLDLQYRQHGMVKDCFGKVVVFQKPTESGILVEELRIGETL